MTVRRRVASSSRFAGHCPKFAWDVLGLGRAETRIERTDCGGQNYGGMGCRRDDRGEFQAT